MMPKDMMMKKDHVCFTPLSSLMTGILVLPIAIRTQSGPNIWPHDVNQDVSWLNDPECAEVHMGASPGSIFSED